MMSSRTIFSLGALLLALGIATGAIGAHGLERLFANMQLAPEDATKRLTQWEIACRYHLISALGLMVAGAFFRSSRTLLASIGLSAALLGAIGFSGGLYALVLTGNRALGASIVPIGGITMVVGWTLVSIGAIVSRSEDQAR